MPMVSRRILLTATAAAALAGVAATPVFAAQRRSRLAGREPNPGQTLAARRSVDGGHLRVASTDFPLSHLAVGIGTGTATVRLRTKDGWGPWVAVTGCGGGPDVGTATTPALLVAPGALGYEVSTPLGAASVVELNTTTVAGASADPPAGGFTLPDGRACTVPYLSRRGWHADENLRFDAGVEVWPAEYYPVQTLTVHHSATMNNDPDPAATVRAIYHSDAPIAKAAGVTSGTNAHRRTGPRV